MVNVTRFTIYAVSRKCQSFTSDDGIPWEHASDERTAQALARILMRDADAATPTRIVERDRRYPFTVRRVVWRCDD